MFGVSWTNGWTQRAEYLVDDFSPYFLQLSMFITTVREQGSDEQRAYWLPLIEQWKIYGAYAQVSENFTILPNSCPDGIHRRN